MTRPLVMSIVENLLRKGVKVTTPATWNNTACILTIQKVWTCTREGGWKEAVFEGRFLHPTGIYLEDQRRHSYDDCEHLELSPFGKSWTLL